MIVYFEDVVHEKLRDFYMAAMKNHDTETDEQCVWVRDVEHSSLYK
jgi:hypothetical protein